MCLNQTEGWSNSRYFSRSNMQRLVNTHPCGHCAECIAQQRNEWYIRSYYQSKSCLENGGFFIEDVLTYEDGHLPHVSDFFDIDPNEANFSCVDKRGVQLFLDRLAKLLKYRYYGANFGISHFICSEYGHDKTYMRDNRTTGVGTVRPHYHCFFFVSTPKVKVSYTVNKRTRRAVEFCASLGIKKDDIVCGNTYSAIVRLTPEDFMRLLCEAWQNGNTMNYKRFAKSGVLYRHPFLASGYRKYVFDDLTKADSDLRAVTNYMTKYITKGDDYSAKIGKRALYLSRLLSQGSSGEKEAFKAALKEVRSKIGLFKLVSDGYGKSFLDTEAVAQADKIEREGLFVIDDKDQVKRECVVPLYYMRKMFYDWRRDDEGHVQWYLNSRGVEVMPDIVEARVSRVAKRYRDICVNMDSESRAYVDYLLEGHCFDGKFLGLDRTIEDFARYLLVYRGRILHPWSAARPMSLPSVREVIESNNSYSIISPDCKAYENNGHLLVESVTPYYHKVHRRSRFARRYCINEDTVFDGVKPFRDFDELSRFFRAWRVWLDTNKEGDSVKETTFRYLEDLRDNLKTIF